MVIGSAPPADATRGPSRSVTIRTESFTVTFAEHGYAEGPERDPPAAEASTRPEAAAPPAGGPPSGSGKGRAKGVESRGKAAHKAYHDERPSQGGQEQPKADEELIEREFLSQAPLHAFRLSGRSMFYVVYRAVGHEEPEGIWHCDWSKLEELLPGASLADCPTISLKGQPSLQAAIRFWCNRRGNSVPPPAALAPPPPPTAIA
jgi:hypothetical protein